MKSPLATSLVVFASGLVVEGLQNKPAEALFESTSNADEIRGCFISTAQDSSETLCRRTKLCCDQVGGSMIWDEPQNIFFCSADRAEDKYLACANTFFPEADRYCGVIHNKEILPHVKLDKSALRAGGERLCSEVERVPIKKPEVYPNWGWPTLLPGLDWGCVALYLGEAKCEPTHLCCDKMSSTMACGYSNTAYCVGIDHFDWNLWCDCVKTQFAWVWFANCDNYWPTGECTFPTCYWWGKNNAAKCKADCPYEDATYIQEGNWTWPSDMWNSVTRWPLRQEMDRVDEDPAAGGAATKPLALARVEGDPVA